MIINVLSIAFNIVWSWLKQLFCLLTLRLDATSVPRLLLTHRPFKLYETICGCLVHPVLFRSMVPHSDCLKIGGSLLEDALACCPADPAFLLLERTQYWFRMACRGRTLLIGVFRVVRTVPTSYYFFTWVFSTPSCIYPYGASYCLLHSLSSSGRGSQSYGRCRSLKTGRSC